LIDETGKPVKQAEPGKPVEVLGFNQVPPVGAQVTRTEELLEALPVSQPKPEKIKAEEKKFKLILKADSAGSLEAVKGSLGENVQIVYSGVGEITESDVFLAKTAQAEIIGYQVKVTRSIQKLGEDEGIIIKTYNIIYELLDYLEERALKAKEPSLEATILGKAKIIDQFEGKEKRIAGCQVLEGKIRRRDKIQLQRDDKLIGEAKIVSMKHQKEKAREAKRGTEFGAVFSPELDFKVGDMIISSKPITKAK
jgi:translation initiation factor IF-2